MPLPIMLRGVMRNLPRQYRPSGPASIILLALASFCQTEANSQSLTSTNLIRSNSQKTSPRTTSQDKVVNISGAEINDELLEEAHRKAKYFIDHEKQFHLGVLTTEQSNTKTVGLAETIQKDLPAGIRMLQAVDRDIPDKEEPVFIRPEFKRLVGAMRGAMEGEGRICFSGCGATGRLSILLEASWRQFCQDLRQRNPAISAKLPGFDSRVLSIMTGGDYALIRSVPSFEDFAAFGRRQVQEAKLGKGDVLVAITEGGETSSVIGTVRQAVADGAEVFFVFNNPAQVLAKHIDRSRQIIEDDHVTKLDLTCGAMAVAGSTRMQATTSELLVVGAALELAISEMVNMRLGAKDAASLGIPVRRPGDYTHLLAELMRDLEKPEAIAAIAAMVTYEEQLYRQKGLVTYLADQCLLDIFTDTTERTPTFMLPPFRQYDDKKSPPPWAFVKNPLLSTPQAWHQVLHRDSNCLSWNSEDYRQLDAPPNLKANPPRIGESEMYKFRIGNEDDASRHEVPTNAAIMIVLGDEAKQLVAPEDALRKALETSAKPFKMSAILAVGPDAAPRGMAQTSWHVPVRLEASSIRLWDRLAIKLTLNTVSTATMARLGRLTSNWMIYVEPTNKKLIDRGNRLIAELTHVDYNTACYALHETLEELSRTVKPGQEKPSPVALTIDRLERKKKLGLIDK
jgi:N-acetylmuramic acid 6-phosphate etherase